MYKILVKFPDNLVERFNKIPDPEKDNVLKEANLRNVDENFVPDESDINSLEHAIRYKDTKIQLVKLMLEGMIEDDIKDRVEAQELSVKLLQQYSLSEVIKEYEKQYRKETD